MAKGMGPVEGSTANEVIRVRFRSRAADGFERVNWEARCQCGATVMGESARARVPPLARCEACERILVLLRTGDRT
jgi:hypothetical protein